MSTARGLRGVERTDRTPRWALVAGYRGTRRRLTGLHTVALTADGVEIEARRARLDLPWMQVVAVRSHGGEDADGRPRRIALDVVDADPSAPLVARLTHGGTDRPGGVRTLVLPTAGLDADPALLLAALDHYQTLPGERPGLPGHHWAS
ncbi:hypothetical protein ACR9E3_15155 [Actinomycetospora sp. C-140]